MAKTHTSEKLTKGIYAFWLSPHTVLIGDAVWFWRSYLFIPIAPLHFIDGHISVLN
ncbi:hypothetical protein DESC_580043 [Desulfosarcina cetonica]|nr:hypothetical protein DESC_580043 [Desulfosarcina cetonica]